mmetsp:Transcript_10432/g.23604  ORF Transcript_10432/g.23604 Transcript_10432/m.23604 type:complete len:185 (-) Transcript_10432:77-631(-)
MSQDEDGEAGMFSRGPPPAAAVDPSPQVSGPSLGMMYQSSWDAPGEQGLHRRPQEQDAEEEHHRIEPAMPEIQSLHVSSPHNGAQADESRLPRVGDGRLQTIPPRKDLDKDRSAVGISTCDDNDYGVEYYALQSDDEAPQAPRREGNAAVICNVIAGVLRESVAKFRGGNKPEPQERLRGSLMG